MYFNFSSFLQFWTLWFQVEFFKINRKSVQNHFFYQTYFIHLFLSLIFEYWLSQEIKKLSRSFIFQFKTNSLLIPPTFKPYQKDFSEYNEICRIFSTFKSNHRKNDPTACLVALISALAGFYINVRCRCTKLRLLEYFRLQSEIGFNNCNKSFIMLQSYRRRRIW